VNGMNCVNCMNDVWWCERDLRENQRAVMSANLDRS
jgi:hypothetical protein